MNAAIVAVGTELLGPTRVDTNSLSLTTLLERYGVPVRRKSIVPDLHDRIVAELRQTAEDHDLILITGGLGPTDDDLTREAVAEAFGLRLQEDPEILRELEEKFRSRGLEMPQINVRQAMVFVGQRTLVNRRGTAPGFHLNLARAERPLHVWIFPGVPWELEGMIEAELERWLEEVVPSDHGLFRRVVKITGMTESAVGEKLASFYGSYRGEPVTILSTASEIQIHLQAEGTPDQAYGRLVELETAVREIFGERIYGIDNDRLEEVVGRLLISRGETLATAESCTGGLLGSRITDVSGSSAYFLGGVVAYSREAKLSLLAVEEAVIDQHGEVSEEVSRAMAEGVRRRFSSSWGIGITGIAGPSGGTPAKPVGTVHIAVAGAAGTHHRHATLPPPREWIKHLSTQVALDLLRLLIVREA